jgi:predicted PurR-regulated permease PerM
VPVVTFYLLRDWDLLVAKIHDLLPRRIEPVVNTLARESDEVIGAFLRGQVIVMVALGVLYSTGLAVIGLEFSLLIGMLAGLVSFVPYLGLITGILVASIAALLQFHSLLSLIPVFIVFGIGQLISDFLLTPKLVGDRIGLHPVAVLFAVLAGGHLFGFLGILLALPVAAVIAVLLRHAQDEYLKSVFYSD